MAGALKYLSNVGKSIKYATFSVLKEYNPVVTDYVNTNADTVKEIGSALRSLTDKNNREESQLTSEISKQLSIALKNAKADLKSGNWYNEERASTKQDEALDAYFKKEGIGFDFDDDFDDDMDSDEEPLDKSTTAIISGQKQVANTVSSVGEQSTKVMSQTVMTAAQYQGQVVKGSAKAILASNANNAVMIHGDLVSMNSNIAKLAQFNVEVMGIHLQNAAKFYEKQTSQMDEQTRLLKELVEMQHKMIEGNARRDRNSPMKIGINDIFTDKGALDISALIDYAKAQTGTLGDLADMVKQVKEVGGLESITANPLSIPLKFAIKKMIPKVVKGAFQEFNDTLSGLASTAVVRLQSDLKDSQNPFISLLSNFVPDLSPKQLKVSSYNKDNIAWNGVAQKSVV